MTAEEIIAALNLPLASRVDQRVPKKLLLENGAPTSADKRLINDGVEEIRWVAALKPATIGVPELRDGVREYLEISVLRITLRAKAKVDRIAELVHRAVPYPVLLISEQGERTTLSLAHKRHALNEADKFVLDGEPTDATLNDATASLRQSFLQALDLTRQPRTTLWALYQGWLDTLLAFQAARVTGTFRLFDSAERANVRREALQVCVTLQNRMATLRSAASNASQMARQVEINLELKRCETELLQRRSEL